MSYFERELLELWDRLRAVREPGARDQFEDIRDVLLSREDRARGLDTTDPDELAVHMLYGYLRALSKANFDDQARLQMRRHADLEIRVVAICDRIRAARTLDDLSRQALVLSDIVDTKHAFAPDSLPQYALPRLINYAVTLCEHRETELVRRLATAATNDQGNRRNAERCLEQYQAIVTALERAQPTIAQAEQIVNELTRTDRQLEAGGYTRADLYPAFEARRRAWDLALNARTHARAEDFRRQMAAARAGRGCPPGAAVRRAPTPTTAAPTHTRHKPRHLSRDRDQGMSR